ncbi:MAG: YihA family ribosome biogenesis GTP-binding protein [Sphingobacteriia bacterium]|jgi:GTP-binding protein|nr:YihA family ribosome biogenesis GTP-binding protein [Candidatus Fonsibacter lacus]
MQIKKATFKQSASSLFGCPKASFQEYAFIGRSNVGKSSLINMLCNNNKLAKTSSTPGKTQLINHFIVNEEWYLVDLPGYGFAKTSKSSRAKFETIIFDYCKKRETLVCLFVLIDSRLTLQKIDLEFMLWCAETKIPFSIIYTKTDKNSKSELNRNIKNIEKELLKAWQDMPNSFVTSAEKGIGKDELLEFIAFQINETNTRLKNEKEFKKENPSIDIN